MRSKLGRWGEAFAAAYLQRKHCVIQARNYHSRYGEIDIVASNEVHLIFLEVKTRKKDAMVGPLAAVTLSKQIKLIKTAQLYLLAHPTLLQPRFDVMGLIMTPLGEMQQYEYIKNAFSIH